MLHETLYRTLPLLPSFNPWVMGSIPMGPTRENGSFDHLVLHHF